MVVPGDEKYCGEGGSADLSVFDQRLDSFGSYQETPWGRLRYEQVLHNLTRHLPSQPLRVLDAGGGNGLDAVGLAKAGHHVTVLDASSTSLAAARSHAEAAGVADRLEYVCADIRDPALAPAGREFDVVLCHNVIQYLPEPRTALAALARALRPGGLLSVLAPNPLCDPLASAVRLADLDEALRLLATPDRASVTYGVEYEARSVEDVVADLVSVGMNPPLRYGVRAVCDLIADDEVKQDPMFFAKLLRLENALADRSPYADVARFFHLIAAKPDPPDNSAEIHRRRVPMDLSGYETRVRSGPCFICEFLVGTPGFEHETVYDDGDHVGFLNRYPTLPGYVLVAPRRHSEDVVRDLSPDEYLRLQSAVHTVARAVAAAMNPERVYVFSMGSAQGNAHIHWHIAPLPSGVPYRDQQFHAVMAENGVLAYTPQEFTALADRIRSALTSDPTAGMASARTLPSDRPVGRSGRLVVIRGNSGSGKTTVAKQLQGRFDRAQCVVVPQDVVRREFLRESDVPDGRNVEFLRDIATLGLARGLTVVVEGILTARRYGGMLEQLAARADRALFYAFDLTFDQTLHRHSSRPAKTAEFGREDMRQWYGGWDPLGFVDEVRIDAAASVTEIVDSIHADITADSESISARTSLTPTPAQDDTEASDRPVSGDQVVLRCWGTSHTEHLIATSSRLTYLADLPDLEATVAVDGRCHSGFMQRLQTSLAALLPDVPLTIHNHGRGGATSRDLAAAVENADVAQDLALVECGTNDVLRKYQPGREHDAVDLEEFTRNYRTILEHLTVRSHAVVCLAAPPVGPGIDVDAEAFNRELFSYNLAAQTAARDAGALFVDNWGRFATTAALLRERHSTDGALSPWLSDGIHLSPIGDELVLRSLEDTLIGKNVISALLRQRSAPVRDKTATDVVVRTARVEDIPALVRLRVAVAGEGRWIGAESPVDEAKAADRLQNSITDNSSGVFVGDHRDSGVVAVATAGFTTPGVAEITIMIAADHRGRGLGTTLLDQLIRWCTDNQAHKITLKVWPHNLPAIGLYQRAGFHTEGTLRAHFRRRNGELWDATIMSRLL